MSGMDHTSRCSPRVVGWGNQLYKLRDTEEVASIHTGQSFQERKWGRNQLIKGFATVQHYQPKTHHCKTPRIWSSRLDEQSHLGLTRRLSIESTHCSCRRPNGSQPLIRKSTTAWKSSSKRSSPSLFCSQATTISQLNKIQWIFSKSPHWSLFIPFRESATRLV